MFVIVINSKIIVIICSLEIVATLWDRERTRLLPLFVILRPWKRNCSLEITRNSKIFSTLCSFENTFETMRRNKVIVIAKSKTMRNNEVGTTLHSFEIMWNNNVIEVVNLYMLDTMSSRWNMSMIRVQIMHYTTLYFMISDQYRTL